MVMLMMMLTIFIPFRCCSRMLFVGSAGTGKTMMVHALCREVGANLFDISPQVLAGKYLGAEKQEYLMNALLKVGKSMEPTIFFIDSCETLYTTQAAGATSSQERPQRWASVFYRMMDKIKKGDRMFLIGETTDPFTCHNQAMFDLFRNVIYFPRPDYGSRLILWKEFLARMPKFKADVNLNPSLLAEFSEGYSGQEIRNAIDETLTARRASRFKPVTNMELLMMLTLDKSSAPLYEADVTKWTNWYLSTPLMRRRRYMLEQEEAARKLLEAV